MADRAGHCLAAAGLRQRLTPGDASRWHVGDEARDPHARFVAYVPPGSISRGEALVKTGGGRTVPCAVCHGSNLEGTEEIPPITGRSPTYMVRQLFEFKAGVRRGAQAFQMVPTVANLSLDDMIDLAAYLATLDP